MANLDPLGSKAKARMESMSGRQIIALSVGPYYWGSGVSVVGTFELNGVYWDEVLSHVEYVETGAELLEIL